MLTIPSRHILKNQAQIQKCHGKQCDNLTTVQGTTLVRLSETFRGNKIRDSQMDMSLKSNGRIDRLGGRVTEGMAGAFLVQHKECRLNQSRLLDIALTHEGLNKSDVRVQRAKDTINYVIEGTGEPSRLIFLDVLYSLTSARSIHRKIFRIEPCSESVKDVEDRTTYLVAPSSLSLLKRLKRWEQTQHPTSRKNYNSRNRENRRRQTLCDPIIKGRGGNGKTGKVRYGVEPNCLTPIIVSRNRSCTLQNEYIKVIDLKNGTVEDFDEAVNFPCDVGYDDNINGGFSPSTDAFVHATRWAEMFREWYLFAPLKNPSPRAYVHFGGMLDNAFWDGQNLLLGDGGQYTYPYTELDTVAHELAHGITERSSGMELRKEPGAIAESFSDIVGEVTEKYVRKTNDWVVGADLMKRTGQVIRYFKDPTEDGGSIKHIRDYKKGMNPHFASGLFNRVFYEVAQHLGVRIYWRETSTFEEAACDVIKGAYDCGLDMDVYVTAFQNIGLKLQDCTDIENFILPITDTERRDNLRVSNVVQPMFKVIIPPHRVGFSASVLSIVDVKISLTSSPSRFPALKIHSGVNHVTFSPDLDQVVYIHLSSNEREEHPASTFVSFH